MSGFSRLGEIAEIHYGKGLPSQQRDAKGSYLVFGANGSVGKHSEFLVSFPTIVIGRKGSIGAVHLTPEKFWPIDTTYYLKIKSPETIDREYLYYALRAANLKKLEITTSIPGINRDSLSNVMLKMIDREGQVLISSGLREAENLIALRNQSIEEIDTYLHSAFIEMFGDPRFNPMKFPVNKLEFLIEKIESGKSINQSENDEPNGLRVLKISSVTWGRFNWRESKPLPRDYRPSNQNHFVRVGDFLFSRANTSELVGAVTIVDQVPSNILLPDKLWRIHWCQKSVNPYFALYLLRQRVIREGLSRASSGSSGSMKNISQGKFLNLEVPIPPIDRQAEFAAKVKLVDSLSEKLRHSCDELNLLFQSLLSEAFAGVGPETTT